MMESPIVMSGADLVESAGMPDSRSRWWTLLDWTSTAALLVLSVLALLAIAGPVLWRASPTAMNLVAVLQPPSLQHPMGTDNLGRDVFARFNEGARISLTVGIIVTLVGSVVGSAIGVVAGTFGGWIDAMLMRVMDAVLAFPPLILAMAVTVGLGVGLQTASLGIIITALPYFARLLRSDVIRIRSATFVEATTALGASRPRTIWWHIVPHTTSTLLIQAASVFGYAILTLAALSFVGLGAQIPTPEWGLMITNGLDYALTGQWWLGIFPGIGVLLAVTAASMLADRLRDVLDPRGDYFRL